MNIHHLALGANDVERVAAFYRDAFLLSERKRFHYPDGALRSIWLDLEEGVLMVEHVDTEARARPKMEPGLFIIVFKVNDDDKEEVVERVLDAGGKRDDETDYTIYFRDIEDNRVGISSYPLRELRSEEADG